MNDQLMRIALYLSAFVQAITGEEILPADPEYIKAAIRVIIDDGIMTAQEIRLGALRETDVFIPDMFFPEGSKLR